jgi:hypothetical protein
MRALRARRALVVIAAERISRCQVRRTKEVKCAATRVRDGGVLRVTHVAGGAFGLFLAMGLVACSDATTRGDAGNSAGGSGMDVAAGSQDSGGTGGDAGGDADGSATTTDGATVDAGTADGAKADAGDSAAAVALTLPVQRGALDVLEFGSLSFSVNPSIGARIVSFKLDGDELLTDATANAMYFGSTLWTSPASDFVTTGFMPPAIIDSNPYTTTVSASGVITASSAPYTTTNGKKFSVTKVFTADIANQAIVIDYTITNAGAAAIQLSHWEVTRVFPDGLTFFPAGTTVKANFLMQLMNLQQLQGYTWYDNTTHMALKGESKGGSDSQGGFIAHVASHPKGPLLFIKAFAAIAPAAAPPAPDNFAIEMYCSNAHTYVELEEYSAYSSIAPGATYTQTVHWYLRRLPIGIDRSVGSAALIAAEKAVLGH